MSWYSASASVGVRRVLFEEPRRPACARTSGEMPGRRAGELPGIERGDAGTRVWCEGDGERDGRRCPEL